jgi:hypothetical protein
MELCEAAATRESGGHVTLTSQRCNVDVTAFPTGVSRTNELRQKGEIKDRSLGIQDIADESFDEAPA